MQHHVDFSASCKLTFTHTCTLFPLNPILEKTAYMWVCHNTHMCCFATKKICTHVLCFATRKEQNPTRKLCRMKISLVKILPRVTFPAPIFRPLKFLPRVKKFTTHSKSSNIHRSVFISILNYFKLSWNMLVTASNRYNVVLSHANFRFKKMCFWSFQNGTSSLPHIASTASEHVVDASYLSTAYVLMCIDNKLDENVTYIVKYFIFSYFISFYFALSN